MPSLKLHRTALIACLMMTACATSTLPAPVLPTPLPAAYVQLPPEPPPRTGNTPDDIAMDLKAMYDLYGRVAGQLRDLIIWVQSEGERHAD